MARRVCANENPWSVTSATDMSLRRQPWSAVANRRGASSPRAAPQAAGYKGTTSSRGQLSVQNSTPSSLTWNVSSVWKRTPSW